MVKRKSRRKTRKKRGAGSCTKKTGKGCRACVNTKKQVNSRFGRGTRLVQCLYNTETNKCQSPKSRFGRRNGHNGWTNICPGMAKAVNTSTPNLRVATQDVPSFNPDVTPMPSAPTMIEGGIVNTSTPNLRVATQDVPIFNPDVTPMPSAPTMIEDEKQKQQYDNWLGSKKGELDIIAMTKAQRKRDREEAEAEAEAEEEAKQQYKKMRLNALSSQGSMGNPMGFMGGKKKRKTRKKRRNRKKKRKTRKKRRNRKK